MAAGAPTQNEFDIRAGLPALAVRVAIGVVVIAAISIAIVTVGKRYGRNLAYAGHSQSTLQVELAIADDVVSVPANMIRQSEQRRDGMAKRLDLYAHWPTMSGFTSSLADAFNDVDPATNSILFISVSPRTTTFDMPGRFNAVYSRVVTGPVMEGPGGLIGRTLSEKHGYIGETLYHSPLDATLARRFVARCQDASDTTGVVLAPCVTEIHIGGTLTAEVRFPFRLLEDWKVMSSRLPDFIADLVVDD